jgi:hypothetical protein
MTITLFLLMAIAQFGMQTTVSGLLLQTWSIGQSMTDAYAGIETSMAQREVFASIKTDATRAIYPASVTSQVTIGRTPFKTMTATLIRTYHVYNLNPVTGALSYLLESYVVYTSSDGRRKYCKVSKVYRTQ